MVSETECSSPQFITSKKKIKYQPSSWKFNEFEIRSGESICNGGIIEMKNSLLVWIGSGVEPKLGEVALGMPGDGQNKPLATPLLGGAESIAPHLAMRLASALHQPVYVCCGIALDRFTRPLVERAIIAKIKDKSDS